MLDERMNAKDIAAYAGVHRQTVYRWIKSERFGPVASLETTRSRGRMGRQVVIPRALVEAIIPAASLADSRTPPPVETASVVEAGSAA